MPDRIQFQSPIGMVTVLVCRDAVSAAQISINTGKPHPAMTTNPVLCACRQQMGEYFAGQRKAFDLPLDWQSIRGFQREALLELLKTPYGEVRTYGEISRALGKPAAARAVGMALAKNPLPILIPCHRVVAASGHLTGFSAGDGLNSKAWLLQLEGHRVVTEKLA
ncbi:MAG: methylated-DNA--[protein]-cysteine S-methyltransferase [Chloroflexi bacterium]|nr:methylated-DNA--[protein]-cysteine S-methyltransferase [Chloroflexota bacterium]